MSGSVPAPEPALIHELVARQAARSPRAIAVVDDEREIRYAELDRRANQLAHLLSTAAGPDAPVGVCLHRDANLVIALLAIWKAGAAYVPLDPEHPWERTALIAAETGICAVLTDKSMEDRFEAAGIRPISLTPNRMPAADRPESAPETAVTAGDAAYIIYTSGSTGRPKGVVVSHAGIANRVGWAIGTPGLTAADRVLQKTTMTFDAACWEIFAPLVTGGTVVMAPPGAERDPAAMVRAVAEHRVTVLQVVPSVLRVLLDEPDLARCGTLRLLFSAGEPLHAETVHRFLGIVPADVEVWNTYGPTECSIDVTAFRFDTAQRSGPVPIGEPIDGMRVLVADAGGEPVAPGEPGELYAGGVGVARGYLDRPGLTADRFVPDPDGPPGARLYRTGDLVRHRDDGNLEYIGRDDHQVKVNGVRIEPGEIEAVLAGHPAVRAAAVVPFTEPGGGTALAAYFQAGAPESGAVTAASLRAFLGERLPGTHLPAAFVELDDFPTTSSGKLDRTALPDPRPSAGGDGTSDDTPRTEAQRLVAGIWQDLLDVDGVRDEDDFFDLGGSSLQFARLANRLRAATGKEIGLDKLLAATSVAAQAELIGQDAAEASPLRRVPRTGPLPLSFGQRRLWVLDRLTPRSREWSTGLFLRVPADVPVELVQRTLDALGARHEALRTRFVTEAGEPMQVIDPPHAMPLRTADVSGTELRTVIDRELGRGFDLEHDPVTRGVLFHRTDEPDADQLLVWFMHHIACDGWSSAVLEKEFHQVLGALRAGSDPGLPEPDVQYADYAAWQRDRLTDQVLERELAHWRTVLSGVEPLELRTDKPRPAVRDPRGGAVTFTVPAPVARAVDELARRHQATPFAALMTAYASLLARYTAQWDIPIGTPIAGRGRPELEGVVGFFLNSLVIRCALDPELPFEDALDRVRDACTDALAHQELPFERLVAGLAPERDQSRTPLYQVAFDLHDERLTGSAADPDDLRTLTEVSEVAKTDLTLYMRKEPDGTMVAGFEYAAALFEHRTIERLAGHFLTLLETVTADPRTRLDGVDFLTEHEKKEMARWNRPGSDVPPEPETVVAMLDARVAAEPEAPAVRAGDGELSLAELDGRASALGDRLRNAGVASESVVAVLADRTVNLPVGLLGVWKAGAAYVPLDPEFPDDRLRRVLADSRAAAVVTESAHRARLAALFEGQIVCVDDPSTTPAPPSPGDVRHDLDGLAYVIYTSGSTGVPKGVQVTHRGLANHLRWAVDELATRGTGGAALFSSVAFDLVVPNVWAALLAGRPLHLLPQDMDLTELGAGLAAGGPYGFLKLTPGHLDILAQQLQRDQAANLADVIVVAGEALPPKLADRWARVLGDRRLINEYGPTEASVGTCVHPVSAPVIGDSVPIGRPLPGVTMHVLDERLRPVPTGVAGEIYVGGEGVARGYADQPERTAERFVPDPYGPPGARFYRTGDLARRLPSGDVDFIGRRDGQVKIRGYRLELGEIESVLAAHPAVQAAVVITVRDASGGTSLAAYYVPEPAPSPQDLRTDLATQCAERLPGYMVPSTFTPIEAVPLNANGKLDRAALPAVRTEPVGDNVTPRGLVEERIAALFTDLLGVKAGAYSHFFRAGGNSILAIRLVAGIQAMFRVEIPMRTVFEQPTVAELAEVVESTVRAEIEQMSDEEVMAETMRARESERGPAN